MPITNLNYVSPGVPWPPLSERSRVNAMGVNYNLSKGKFESLIPGTKSRLEENVFSDVSVFWKDALFGEPPLFDYDEDNPRVLQAIDLLTPSAIRAARQVAFDMIRYGVGCFLARKPGELESLDPRYWFPVTDPTDTDIRLADIIAYPFISRPENNLVVDRYRLLVFTPDGCTATTFRVEGGNLGSPIDQVDSPCAFPVVIPAATDDTLYGESIYNGIKTHVAEIHRRDSRISVALDRHAEPHLSVPEGSIRRNSAGQYVISDDGMVIPVADGSQDPKYVTWDANFVEHGNAIKRAQLAIWRHAGISPVLLDPEILSGQIASGAALRRMAVVTVNRLREYRQTFDESLRLALVAGMETMAAHGGEVIKTNPRSIRLLWPPPLSSGRTDDAEAFGQLVTDGIVSRVDAIQIVNRVRRADAERIDGEGSQPTEP